MTIPFEELKTSDLYTDAIYSSNGSGKLSGEVLSKLMGVGNQCGFRKRSCIDKHSLAYVVLESTGKQEDWPDSVDYERRHVIYYGDNRTVGNDFLVTKQGGNALLNKVFHSLETGNKKSIPPFFYFVSDKGRSRKFVGLLVPGHKDIPLDEQLVKVSNNNCDNYKSNFTIVPCEHIHHSWLEDLHQGRGYDSDTAPDNWKSWVDTGVFHKPEDIYFLPEELDKQEANRYIEGATKEILVNAYERSPAARAECIKTFGCKCYVCGFDFGEFYGSEYVGMIHVHHVKPLHEINEQYVVCPETDLRPVCPNCHMLLHSNVAKCLSIDELRKKYHR